MTLSVFLLLAAVVSAAAFVQGAIGIGFALIVAPVLGLVAPDLLPVTLLVLMLPLNALVAWRERDDIDWSGAGWTTIGRFAGTFAGLWLLVVLSGRQLDLAVGGFTILAAIVALAAPSFRPTRPTAVGAGLLTGITETSTGIGGPPLALLYQHASGPVLRSTVAICFLVGELISLAILGVAKEFHAHQALAALHLVPAVILGSALSKLSHSRIRGAGLRISVLTFAIASGSILILRQLSVAQ